MKLRFQGVDIYCGENSLIWSTYSELCNDPTTEIGFKTARHFKEGLIYHPVIAGDYNDMFRCQRGEDSIQLNFGFTYVIGFDYPRRHSPTTLVPLWFHNSICSMLSHAHRYELHSIFSNRHNKTEMFLTSTTRLLCKRPNSHLSEISNSKMTGT